MINGEGTRETSSEPVDELPPWQFQKLDDEDGDESPVYSQYSSCGESEFERYCSANSVMGTPSLCGSVGTFQDCASEFGSVKSLVLGETGSLENFSLGASFARNLGERKPSSSDGSGSTMDNRIECCEGNNNTSEVRNDVELEQDLVELDDGLSSCSITESPLQYDFNDADAGEMESANVALLGLKTELQQGFCAEDDGGSIVRWRCQIDSEQLNSIGSVSVQETTNAEVTEENIFNLGGESDSLSLARFETENETHLQMISGPVKGCLDASSPHSDLECDSIKGGKCSDEDKASSRYEHSEGEDSMFGCGTDDEEKIDLLRQRNTQYHQEEKRTREHSLLMSSAVAYGSDDWDDFMLETAESDMNQMTLGKQKPNLRFETNPLSSSRADTDFACPSSASSVEVVAEVSLAANQVHGADELPGCIKIGSVTPAELPDSCEAEQAQGKDEDCLVSSNQVGEQDKLAENLETAFLNDISVRDQDLLPEGLLNKGLNMRDSNLRKESPLLSAHNLDKVEDVQALESEDSKKLELQLDPLSDSTASQLCPSSAETPESQIVNFQSRPCLLPSNDGNVVERSYKDSPSAFNIFDYHPRGVEADNLELNEFYFEVVNEMEGILLDSTESPGARFAHTDVGNRSYLSLPFRDGSSTASTSGDDSGYPLMQRPLTIDGLEVIGAKQKKGDVSFGERLVGVKEYTVYVIKVWSGKDHWEVERRYRDFCTLYRRLKTLFAGQGWILPSPWFSVERESRKIFGNVSPDVVSERSALIQECLRSILHPRFSPNNLSPLIWFLSPPKIPPSSPPSNTHPAQSSSFARGTETGNGLTFGKTISLIVEIRPHQSLKQILEAQYYTCAGCHRHFDDDKTRMLEFVQTLGWGKPRLCEYTGQAFCSSCHTNETAVLPARVLHHWDFTEYAVSQFAKSYLDSIHDQPMLCVSAVNPFLFSKVPALQQVTSVRKKIGAMLPYVRCPFRMSIFKGLGSRRYLLESNDFFALRDLIDLSKGPFAALPAVVETVSRKILQHITEQCLVCCDVGIPCNARQTCHDPSSLIFPFQEAEIERCKACKSAFHKPCFRKMIECPCGEPLNQEMRRGSSADVNPMVDGKSGGTLDLPGRKLDSTSTMGLLSGLFTKARQDKSWWHKDSDTVILMGSLPSTSL
ncbi:hypothetical protein NMG60_11019322 [Bertholletia excelsa]